MHCQQKILFYFRGNIFNLNYLIMQDYRQVQLRDFLFEPIILNDDELICLYIHDTCDKNLSGLSAGESDDFSKAAFIVEKTKDYFFIDRFEYLETDEKIGFYNSWVILLYGKIIDAENLASFLKEYSVLMIKDFSQFEDSKDKEENYYGAWEEIKELRFQIVDEDLWLQKECPLPELYRVTALRILLYEILLIQNEVYDPDDVDIDDVLSHLKRIAPEFPEDSYFGGPNIS